MKCLKQQRFADAERLLREVAEGCRNMSIAREGEHLDRVKALELLCTCLQLQGRLDEAMDTCDHAMEMLKMIGGHAHPYMKILKDKCAKLQELG